MPDGTSKSLLCDPPSYLDCAGANLQGMVIESDSPMWRTPVFNRANLEGASLIACYCLYAKFNRANLKNANLTGLFESSDFKFANIEGAHIEGNFLGVNFMGSNLKRVRFDNLF